jgi:hypothetical protein
MSEAHRTTDERNADYWRAGCECARAGLCYRCLAAAEIERLEREREGWASVAATRNVNIALIAEERDRLRAALNLERQRLVSWADRLNKRGKNEAADEVWERVEAIDQAMSPALDVGDDGKCWIKGCQQPKGHAGFCDPLPDSR